MNYQNLPYNRPPDTSNPNTLSVVEDRWFQAAASPNHLIRGVIHE